MAEETKLDEIKEFEEEVVPNATNIKTQETFLLPSKGIFYSNPNMKSITLRRMTVKEDKIRMRNEADDKIRRDLLQACTVGEGIDIGQLTLFDASYLLFGLRRISLLNNMYKIKCTCPHCKAEFIDEVDLTKINVKYADENNLPNLNITLPLSNIKMTLKFPTLGSSIIFREKLVEYMNNNPSADLGEILYTIGDMLYIDKVNDSPILMEELEDLIDELDIVDIRALKKAVKGLDNVFGIDDEIKCLCPKCKKEVTHGLPITGELFNPSL